MINNVVQLLQESARAYPDKTALADDKSAISFSQYLEWAEKTGTYLIRKTGGAKRRAVAVLIGRNVDSIVAFLGVACSGNYYVPVDTALPAERIRLILERTDPVIMIDARKQDSTFENAVRFEDILRETERDGTLLKLVQAGMLDTDPLYAIFTSGSTGIPKGVLIPHRAVLDLVWSFEDAFGFTDGNVFGNQAPFDFDVSVKDIYNALYKGARLEVLPRKLFKMPKLLTEYIRERGIDTLIWAVSAYRIVAEFDTFSHNEAPKLKNAMFSGEVMPVKVLDYWRTHIPEARYVNLYGPTEITCNCTYHLIEGSLEDDSVIPIGRAFRNTSVFLLDEEGTVIEEKNKLGEICISGSCLALGYVNDEEMTARAFVRNRNISAYPSIMYRSGDLGFYDENGDLVFSSRRDSQIKHMGHRIELGEIELVLNSVRVIDIGCCLYDEKREQIICFYQSDDERKKEIVKALSEKLPKYMWPTEYIRYQKMPMN